MKDTNIFPIGEYISAGIAERFKRFTVPADRIDASIECGISLSIMEKLVARSAKITENNRPGLVALLKIAERKSAALALEAETAHKYFSELIETDI